MFFDVFRPPREAGRTSPATGEVAWQHLECEARANLDETPPVSPRNLKSRASTGFQGMAQ